MSRMSEIIAGLRAHEAEELQLEPRELTVEENLPSELRIDTIARASSHLSNMIETLLERKVYVQEQLNLYNEEMRQIQHVLNYAEPAHDGIIGGAR